MNQKDISMKMTCNQPEVNLQPTNSNRNQLKQPHITLKPAIGQPKIYYYWLLIDQLFAFNHPNNRNHLDGKIQPVNSAPEINQICQHECH